MLLPTLQNNPSLSLSHPERVRPQLLHDGRGTIHPLWEGGGNKGVGVEKKKNTRRLAPPCPRTHTNTHTSTALVTFQK